MQDLIDAMIDTFELSDGHHILDMPLSHMFGMSFYFTILFESLWNGVSRSGPRGLRVPKMQVL